MSCACDTCTVPSAERAPLAVLAKVAPKMHPISVTLGAGGRSEEQLSAPGPCSGWLVQLRTSAAAEVRIQEIVPSPGGALRFVGPLDLVPAQAGQGSTAQAVTWWIPYAAATLTLTSTPGATIQGRAMALDSPPVPGDGLRWAYRSERQTIAAAAVGAFVAPGGARRARVLSPDPPGAAFAFRISVVQNAVPVQLYALSRTGSVADQLSMGPAWIDVIEGVTSVDVTNADAVGHDFVVEWAVDLWA